jgi:hypothetical protein
MPFLFQSLQCLKDAINLYSFIDFKAAKWAVSSLFKSFLRTVNMFISIFVIQILQQLIFRNIGRNWLLGNRKKVAKV